MANKLNEKIVFKYENGKFSLDRNLCGDLSFSPDFAGISSAERISLSNNLNIYAYVDHSSIEIFLDDGQNIFSELFFPTTLYTEIEIEGLDEFSIRELKDIWR